MTKINAKLILASRNAETLDTLFSFVLTGPKYLVAELNTHRAFSRNSASSRAVPGWKIRRRITNDPFTPTHFPAEQRGMQGGEDLAGWRQWLAQKIWNAPRYAAVIGSWALSALGVHKQIANRLTEPWMWTEVLVSMTDLNNFFKLRADQAAEPHFQDLAKQMRYLVSFAEGWLNGLTNFMGSAANHISIPVYESGSIYDMNLHLLKPGEWHLPFVTLDDRKVLNFDLELMKKVSTARSARTSYYLPENGMRSDIARDLELHDRLAASGHWSPFEHPACAISASSYVGNFRGFRQYRKEFEGEHGGDR